MLIQVDLDIAAGKIELYTDQRLKDLQVYKIFEHNVNENRNLYSTGDLGEVYAISLAQTLGAYSLVTDDTKWIKKLASDNKINIQMKLAALSKLL